MSIYACGYPLLGGLFSNMTIMHWSENPEGTSIGSREWRLALNESIRNELRAFSQRLSQLSSSAKRTELTEPPAKRDEWERQLKALSDALEAETRRFVANEELASRPSGEIGEVPPWLVVVRAPKEQSSGRQRPQTSQCDAGGEAHPQRPQTPRRLLVGRSTGGISSPRAGMKLGPIGSSGASTARATAQEFEPRDGAVTGTPRSARSTSAMGARPPSVVGMDRLTSAQTTLNAAAIQSFSRLPEPPLYRVQQKGSLLWADRPSLLSGVESSDVSYLADRKGHGLDLPTALRQRRSRTRAVPLPWPIPPQLSSATAAPRGGGGTPPPSASAHADEPSRVASSVPSSRAEAVAAAAKLRQDLQWLSQQHIDNDDNRLRAEVALWDETFEEVVRQVSVHCSERGKLLKALRERHNQLLHQLIELRAHEVETARQDALAEKDALAEAKDKAVGDALKTSTAMYLTKAANKALLAAQTERAESAQDLVITRTAHIREDLEAASIYRKVLEKQLAEAREDLEAAQHKFDHMTGEELIIAIGTLNKEDLGEVTRAAILLPQQAALQHVGSGDAEACMLSLIQPLHPATASHLLTTAFIKGLRPNDQMDAVAELLRKFSAEDLGVLFAGQLKVPAEEAALLLSVGPAGGGAQRRKRLAKYMLTSLGSVEESAPEYWAVLCEVLGKAAMAETSKMMEEKIAISEDKIRSLEAAAVHTREGMLNAEATRDLLRADFDASQRQLSEARAECADALQLSGEALGKIGPLEEQVRRLERELERSKSGLLAAERQAELSKKQAEGETRAAATARDMAQAKAGSVESASSKTEQAMLRMKDDLEHEMKQVGKSAEDQRAFLTSRVDSLQGEVAKLQRTNDGLTRDLKDMVL